MSHLRSLRAQIVIGVTLLVVAVVGVSGLVIAQRIEDQDRSQVDRQLMARAAKASEDADRLLTDDKGATDENAQGGSSLDSEGDLLGGSESLVRVLSAGIVVDSRGEQAATQAPVPTATGLGTIEIDGQAWRSLVQGVADHPGAEVQVLQSLAPVEQRRSDNGRLVATVTALATVIAGVSTWLLAGLVLRPLQRLRKGAVSIAPEAGSDQRLPDVRSPQEVAELSATLNAMLERLQASLEATRRFTADAGHELRTPLTGLGVDLETLQRHPELSAERRAEVLDAMVTQHQRIVALLGGLQQLARGDAGALPTSDLADLGEIAHAAVSAAERRHPGISYRFQEASQAGAVILGWPDGLRMAIDNLLDNAALHGRPNGTVDVRVVCQEGSRASVVVTDDGPGVPDEERVAITQRFRRGSAPRSSGSGLGLALVEQQARLHGGSLDLAHAAGGGLEVTFSVTSAGGATQFGST